MAADVDVRVIKKTQDALGTIIKKPPLNEKLLNKPPFRFLHDIITNVINNTGFMSGLYTPDELVSDNVKEKDSKIAFLQKALDVVSMVTGQQLTARPTKIVAGQEPTKTNEFLQALGKALTQKLNSDDAVKRVLSGEKPSLPDKKATKVSQPTNRAKVNKVEKKTIESSTKPNKTPDKLKTVDKSKDPLHKASKEIRTVKDSNKTKDGSKLKAPTKKPKEDSKSSRSPKASKPEPKVTEPEVPAAPEPVPDAEPEETVRPNTGVSLGEPLATPPPPTPKPEPIPMAPFVPPEPDVKASPAKETRTPPSARPAAPSRQSRHRPSAKPKPELPVEQPAATKQEVTPPPEPAATQFTGDPVPRPQSVMRARSARPSTARPAPPRIINRNIVNAEEVVRAPSAKPVTNLILDTDEKENEEDEGFVVEDTAVTEAEELVGVPSTSEPSGIGEGVSKEDEEAAQQGSLVRQMLQTKKGLEGGSQANRKIDPELEVEESEPASSRQRETTSKELEQLRQYIQTVSRSANPLGKMLDYLQEDIDSMNSELRMWREEHRNNLVALRREEGITDNLLDPLNKQLEELEQSVQDQRDQISALKAAILHNDKRIHSMLLTPHK